jgi:hypothetical protein
LTQRRSGVCSSGAGRTASYPVYYLIPLRPYRCALLGFLSWRVASLGMFLAVQCCLEHILGEFKIRWVTCRLVLALPTSKIDYVLCRAARDYLLTFLERDYFVDGTWPLLGSLGVCKCGQTVKWRGRLLDAILINVEFVRFFCAGHSAHRCTRKGMLPA